MNQDIKKFKKRYQGEWLTIKQGKVVAHNRDRRKLHEEVRKKKLKGVYITFSGPIVKPGYEVILGVEGLLGLSFLDRARTIVD